MIGLLRRISAVANWRGACRATAQHHSEGLDTLDVRAQQVADRAAAPRPGGGDAFLERLLPVLCRLAEVASRRPGAADLATEAAASAALVLASFKDGLGLHGARRDGRGAAA